MKKLVPAIPSPPGRILKRELIARGWTQKNFALLLGRPVQLISEIINGKKKITAETALELEEALGISSEIWLKLELDYQIYLAKKKHKTKIQQIQKRLSRLEAQNLCNINVPIIKI